MSIHLSVKSIWINTHAFPQGSQQEALYRLQQRTCASRVNVQWLAFWITCNRTDDCIRKLKWGQIWSEIFWFHVNGYGSILVLIFNNYSSHFDAIDASLPLQQLLWETYTSSFSLAQSCQMSWHFLQIGYEARPETLNIV